MEERPGALTHTMNSYDTSILLSDIGHHWKMLQRSMAVAPTVELHALLQAEEDLIQAENAIKAVCVQVSEHKLEESQWPFADERRRILEETSVTTKTEATIRMLVDIHPENLLVQVIMPHT